MLNADGMANLRVSWMPAWPINDCHPESFGYIGVHHPSWKLRVDGKKVGINKMKSGVSSGVAMTPTRYLE
jgi:hypothetical protein